MRLMTMDDYDQVYELWKLSEGMDINETDEGREGIAKYLKRNAESCFVEERDGKIVGVILAGQDGRRGTLHHLTVRKDLRRQGIGSSLVNAAATALKKQGISRIGLFVYNDNLKGLAFWKAMGFIRQNDYCYLDKATSDYIL